MTTTLLQATARKAGSTNLRITDPVSGKILVLPTTVTRGLATLPISTPSTTYPTVTGATTLVHSGGDLQAAINAAARGDELVLDAGATWTGNYTLPAKSGTGVVIIRSANLSSLAVGTRVAPTDVSNMATILTPNSGFAFTTATSAAAGGYRLSGLEIAPVSTVTVVYTIVQFGDGSSAQNSLSLVPDNLILDRCYLHGNTHSLNSCHGLGLHCSNGVAVDCYISGIHETGGGDCQAIYGGNGPGPYYAKNCYLEASCENVLFGGSDPFITNLVPSDITIEACHFYKPAAWNGVWQVKNILEFKNARRVLVKHNVFENCWVDAQDGTALLVTPVNQNRNAPWCTVQDVTYDTNRVINVARAMTFASNPGYDETAPATRSARISVKNMLIEKLGGNGDYGDGGSHQIVLLANVDGVSLQHITAFSGDDGLYFTGPQYLDGFLLRDSIIGVGDSTIHVDTYGVGSAALAYFCSSPYAVDHNVFVLPSGITGYPSGNWAVASQAALSLNTDMSLPAGSPYKSGGADQASDGTDVGADVAGILAATSGVVQVHG